MIGLIDAFKIGAGVALGAALVAAPAHYLGRQAGLREARTAALEKSMETLRERKRTDENIEALDDTGLCGALGGVLANGRCE